MKIYSAPLATFLESLCSDHCADTLSSDIVVDNNYKGGYTQGTATDVFGDES